MNRKKITEFIKSVQTEGKKIVVEWDAGGDQTPVWFKIWDKTGKEIEEGRKNEDYWMFLRDFIVYELGLPNAGERYHRGKGEISCENEQVYISYSAKEFTEDYEDETIEFTLEDRFGLLNCQYKAHISFSLRLGEVDRGSDLLDEYSKEGFWVHKRILEGDDIIVTDEMTAYYKEQFEQVGKRFEAELGQTLFGKTLCEITLTYDEQDLLGRGMLKVDKYYELSQLYENEKRVLIGDDS